MAPVSSLHLASARFKTRPSTSDAATQTYASNECSRCRRDRLNEQIPPAEHHSAERTVMLRKLLLMMNDWFLRYPAVQQHATIAWIELRHRLFRILTDIGRKFDWLLRAQELIRDPVPDRLLCRVCLDREVQVALRPCGHIALCRDCVTSLTECPICREDIIRTYHIYIP